MPDFLQAKLEGSSIRALYELYQAWRVCPDEIELRCAIQDSFTDVQARQLAREVRAESDRAAAENGSIAGPARSERRALSSEAVLQHDSPKAPKATIVDRPSKTRIVTQLKSAASLAIRVRYQNSVGQLIVDRLATRGSLHAVVLVDGADCAEEFPVSTLTIEEILSR